MIVTTEDVVARIKLEHKEYFVKFFDLRGRAAILGIVRVGDNKVSSSYIKIKKKYAQFVGVEVSEYIIPSESSQKFLEEEIGKACVECDGVIVQLPLPHNFDTKEALKNIDLEKDIDQLHPENEGTNFVQPVVFAIKEIIENYNIELSGKKVAVLGQGSLVGKPFSKYLEEIGVENVHLDKNTEEHFKEKSLKEAEVLVTGVGLAGVVTKEMVGIGVVIIDAGTSEDGDSVVGDVSRDCAEIAEILVTTPGGVGPLTVCGLFNNLKIATQKYGQV